MITFMLFLWSTVLIMLGVVSSDVFNSSIEQTILTCTALICQTIWMAVSRIKD